MRHGDVFHESAGVVIEKVDATGEGVTFLAYFPLAAGEEPAIEAATAA